MKGQLLILFKLSICFLLSLLPYLNLHAQDITKTEDKDILKIYYAQHSESLRLEFRQVPELLDLGSVHISCGDQSMYWKIDLYQGPDLKVDLNNDIQLYEADTITFAIIVNEKVYYSYSLIVHSGDMGNLELGKDCYLFNCSPWQDPYMPTVPDYFLIDPKANYKHKESGKIKSGKKLIYRFDACELREWEKIEI